MVYGEGEPYTFLDKLVHFLNEHRINLLPGHEINIGQKSLTYLSSWNGLQMLKTAVCFSYLLTIQILNILTE